MTTAAISNSNTVTPAVNASSSTLNPAAVVPANQSDAINNSADSTVTNEVAQNNANASTGNQSSSANHRTVNMDQDEYSKFRLWVTDTKSRNVADKLKAMKDKVVIRRQALVMRRVDIKVIAPDEDVAAYQEVYRLKNPTADSRNKTFVTDNEIKAFKVLDPRFDSPPSLAEISAKVEELKAAGQLSAEGDNVSADEDQV